VLAGFSLAQFPLVVLRGAMGDLSHVSGDSFRARLQRAHERRELRLDPQPEKTEKGTNKVQKYFKEGFLQGKCKGISYLSSRNAP
jgi:hypothetical protein